MVWKCPEAAKAQGHRGTGARVLEKEIFLSRKRHFFDPPAPRAQGHRGTGAPANQSANRPSQPIGQANQPANQPGQPTGQSATMGNRLNQPRQTNG